MHGRYQHTLRLTFHLDGPDAFRVDATTPATAAHARFTRADLDAARGAVTPAALFDRKTSPGTAAAAAYGARLWNAVFRDDVHRLFYSLVPQGVRLALDFTAAPELAAEAWELLFDPRSESFFVLHPSTPVVREVAGGRAAAPFALRGPLVVGVLIASPQDRPLDAPETQWEAMRAAVEQFGAEQVKVFRIPPTLEALREFLATGACHVLHFVGHGEVNLVYPQGALLFEDAAGRADHVTAQKLSTVLGAALPALRVVFLSACDSASSAIRDDPYAGIAARLAQQGVPAVVAMQYPISERAADTLASEFYERLLEGRAPEAALTYARLALHLELGAGVEWATPVLTVRSLDDGVLTPATSAAEGKRPLRLRAMVEVTGPGVDELIPIDASSVAIVTPALYARLGTRYTGAVRHAEIVVRRERLVLYEREPGTEPAVRDLALGEDFAVGPFRVAVHPLGEERA